jgi:hypothetical protein
MFIDDEIKLAAREVQRDPKALAALLNQWEATISRR